MVSVVVSDIVRPDAAKKAIATTAMILALHPGYASRRLEYSYCTVVVERPHTMSFVFMQRPAPPQSNSSLSS